jgi:hypothetical protein
MLVILLGVIFAIVGLCPESDIGKLLRRALVEAPARKLARMTRRRMILGAALLVFLVGAIALARLIEDGMVFVQFVPEGVAWMAAFDVASYLELMAAVWLVAGALSLRAVDQAMKAAAARARQWAANRLRMLVAAMGRLAERRAHRIRRRIAAKKPKDGDRPAPGLVFA